MMTGQIVDKVKLIIFWGWKDCQVVLFLNSVCFYATIGCLCSSPDQLDEIVREIWAFNEENPALVGELRI